MHRPSILYARHHVMPHPAVTLLAFPLAEVFPIRVPKANRQPKRGKKKERKKTDNPREGWEDGTPPPHRDFKEGTVWC